jgi:putative hemolysin
MESTLGFSLLPAQAVDGFLQPAFAGISDERYTVRLAEDRLEVESALRLRYDIFNVELGGREAAPGEARLEFDTYDLKCRHLIVVSRETGETVGTYRLNSIETAHSIQGFYSANEFTIEDLPGDVLHDGIEIGRACIAREHRNTKVLFLLWKALLAYLEQSGKRYFFGCCSIFTQDADIGRKMFKQLVRDGYFHENLSVMPCHNALSLVGEDGEVDKVELPALFNMYLRIGARVCGPPMIDREFGTIDFFVVFDVAELNEKYRKLFS